MAPDMFTRLGHPDLRRRASPATTRSATTRARSGRTTRRSSRPGFKRYGFHDEANLLVRPDLRGGPALRRTSACPSCSAASTATSRAVPVPYPVACSPQAWAAGSPFLFLETMLGLRPHAPPASWSSHRPELPDWLGKVTVTNLRVGDAAVDLLFHRWRGGDDAPRCSARAGDLVRHDPAVAPDARRAFTVAELVDRVPQTRLTARGRRTRRGSTRSCCWRRRWASTGPGSLAYPDAPVGDGARETFEASIARRRARRARRLHPRLPRVPRPRLRRPTRGRSSRGPRPSCSSMPRSRRSSRRLAGTPRAPGAPGAAGRGRRDRDRARSRSRSLSSLRRRKMADEVLVIAIDVSEDALQLARENAVGHGVADRMRVRGGGPPAVSVDAAVRRRRAPTSRTCRPATSTASRASSRSSHRSRSTADRTAWTSSRRLLDALPRTLAAGRRRVPRDRGGPGRGDRARGRGARSRAGAVASTADLAGLPAPRARRAADPLGQPRPGA